MKVILKQAVETLGEAGDIVTVKAGFGRNYLLPQGLAVLATKSSMLSVKNEIELKEMKEAKSKKGLQLIADKLNSLKLTFAVKAGEDEKLFGSVTTQMISDDLAQKGFNVEKKHITLDDAIKSLGNHFAHINFGDEITAKIKLKVVAEED